MGAWLCRHDRHRRLSPAAADFALALRGVDPATVAHNRVRCPRCHVVLGRRRWTIGWRAA